MRQHGKSARWRRCSLTLPTMTWEDEIAAAKRERAKRASVEESAKRVTTERREARDAGLRGIAEEVERVLLGFDAVGWEGAKKYRPGFDGYLKLIRQLRGQEVINIEIPEFVVSPSSRDSPWDVFARIDFYRYEEDGRRAYVWSGPPSSLGGFSDSIRSGVVDFCGDPLGKLKPEFVVRAVARWSVEHEVSLSL